MDPSLSYSVDHDRHTIKVPLCAPGQEPEVYELPIAHQFKTRYKSAVQTETYVVYLTKEVLAQVYDIELMPGNQDAVIDAVLQIKHLDPERSAGLENEEVLAQVSELRRASEVYRIIGQHALERSQESKYVDLVQNDEIMRRFFPLIGGIAPDKDLSRNVPNISYCWDDLNQVAVMLNAGVRNRTIRSATAEWNMSLDKLVRSDTKPPQREAIEHMYKHQQMTRQEFWERKEEAGKRLHSQEQMTDAERKALEKQSHVSLFEILANLYRDLNAIEKGFSEVGLAHGDLNWGNIFRSYSMIFETFGHMEEFNHRRIIPGITLIDFESARITNPDNLRQHFGIHKLEELLALQEGSMFYMTIGLVPIDGIRPTESSELFSSFVQYANLLTGHQPYVVPIERASDKPVQMQTFEYFASLPEPHLDLGAIADAIPVTEDESKRQHELANKNRLLSKLNNLFTKGLASNPALRYHSCAEARRDIEDILFEFGEEWTVDAVLASQSDWKGIFEKQQEIEEDIEQANLTGGQQRQMHLEFLRLHLDYLQYRLDMLETSDFAANNIYQTHRSLIRGSDPLLFGDDLDKKATEELSRAEVRRIVEGMRQVPDFYGVQDPILETYRYPYLERIKIAVKVSQKRYIGIEPGEKYDPAYTVFVDADKNATQAVAFEDIDIHGPLAFDVQQTSQHIQDIDPQEAAAGLAVFDALDRMLDESHGKGIIGPLSQREFEEAETKISQLKEIIAPDALDELLVDNPELLAAVKDAAEEQDVQIIQKSNKTD